MEFTVNSEISWRVLYFLKIRSSRNDEITLSFSDIVESCRRKNKILTKISEFTVESNM